MSFTHYQCSAEAYLEFFLDANHAEPWLGDLHAKADPGVLHLIANIEVSNSTASLFPRAQVLLSAV